jgi:hypothetical protein
MLALAGVSASLAPSNQVLEAQCAKCNEANRCNFGPIIGGFVGCEQVGPFCVNIEPTCGPPISFNSTTINSFGLLAVSSSRAVLDDRGRVLDRSCFGALVALRVSPEAASEALNGIARIVI